MLNNLRRVHDHRRLLSVLREQRIIPVFTPIEASWLNLVEAQFGALKRATLTSTDDCDHVTRQRRMHRYLRKRHRTLGIAGHPPEGPPSISRH